MGTDELVVSDESGHRRLTIVREPARNALSMPVLHALADAIAGCHQDGIGVMSIHGRGSTFCSGLDRNELASGTTLGELWEGVVDGLLASTTPIIAAVNGPAVTAGLGLVVACDFAIAASTATFAETHASMGVLSRSGATTLLFERVGRARAREMMLTGRPIDAVTAYEWGLVNAVVPDERLETEITRRADLILRHDRPVIAAILAGRRQAEERADQGSREAERTAADSWRRQRAK